MHLAKVSHFQFQAAVMKFSHPNLVYLRYVRKYKHLPSLKSSCGLAVPGCELKLTGRSPFAGHGPAMLLWPSLIEIYPNCDEKWQCCLLAGLLA